MKSAKHLVGRLFNLVGITNPEDVARKKAATPSWKNPSDGKKTREKAQEKQK